MGLRINFGTELSDLPSSTLKKLHKFIGDEFVKPFIKAGAKGEIWASPWRIMLPIQYEMENRFKKKAK